MAYIRFYYPSRDRDGVTVNKSGDITISKSIASKHQLGQYVCVILEHDEKEPMMKLKFLSERIPATAGIRNGTVIAAKVFVRHLKIAAGHYEAHWIEKEKALECIYNVTASEAA